jgi:hypothetical protein
MFWEIFVVGEVWFWLLSLVLGGFFLVNLFHEKVLGATTSLIIYGLIITFFGNFNIFDWAWDNPGLMAQWAGTYLVVGILWSILRWYLFNTKIKWAYNEIRADFKKKHNITSTTIPNEYRSKWQTYLNSHHDSWERVTRYYDWRKPYTIEKLDDIIPKSRDYRRPIICWMAYWPLSLVFFLLHDFISGLFERLYQILSNVYGMISTAVFGKMVDDLKPDDKLTTPPEEL